MTLFLTYHQIRPDERDGDPEFYTVSRAQLVRQLDALAAANIPCVTAATLLAPRAAAHTRTSSEPPALKLPRVHEMEERGGERRSVLTKPDTLAVLKGLPSPRPSPTPSSWEREKTSGAIPVCAPTGDVCILSFDDATLDHYEVVFPLLQERGLRAVFFVPTSKLNRPGRLTDGQVREMAGAGHTIGLHSHEHKRLDRSSDDDLREQMSQSQQLLSDLTAEKPWIFAPPGGFLNEHVREVALGFGVRAIRTMRWGYNQSLDLSAMDTIPVNRHTDDRKFLKVIEARQSRFLYFSKQATKALIPARAYERLRGVLFRAAGKQ